MAEDHVARDLPGRGRWLRWAFGLALLTVVVLGVLHRAEAEELARIVEEARPVWLGLAVALQAATYHAAGHVLRVVARASNHVVDAGSAWRLSLMKLFFDQAIPSGGLGGTFVLAQGLERLGLPRATVAATLIVAVVSYYASYAACLVAAVAFVVHHGEANLPILIATGLLLGFGVMVSGGAFFLASDRQAVLPAPLRHIRPLRRVAEYLRTADLRTARDLRVLTEAGTAQIVVVLLDVATVWTLLRAVGAECSPAAVFASFMISSLLRSVGIVPGGLGTFEAASVVTLHLLGVPTAAALAATLLFRGLSFWLPMIPGLWLSRHLLHPTPDRAEVVDAYWAHSPTELLARLRSAELGLSSIEAGERLRTHGKNRLDEERALTRLRVVARQLRSPLLLLLVFAAGISGASGEWTDAAIVGTILLASVGISAAREYSAQAAAAALRARVATRARVLRDGDPAMVPVENVVPGDVILLAAGSVVPADAVVLEATDCHVSEAVLTGESFPVEKTPGAQPRDTPLSRRTGCVFQGTNVRSGAARCLVVATGRATEFGLIAHRLTLKPPETDFERGVRRFGTLLSSAMLGMVLLVFVAHMIAGRAPGETLLFAIALAVGLSPELLPAILTVNLARGARLMARDGVLVRRLNAIENLGSMDILCTDKTGTLTEGVVRLDAAWDAQGNSGEAALEVLELGAVNALLETGLPSPLDDAILAARMPDATRLKKRAEIPFDFTRKRVSVVVEGPTGLHLITKGAFQHVVNMCSFVPSGEALDDTRIAELTRLFESWSGQGLRVLAVAEKTVTEKLLYGRDDESDLTFAGFLTFLDRPKEGVREAIGALAALGVSVKLITGDNRLVARHVAELVGLPAHKVLTGDELDELHDEALWHAAERTDLFVEVDPNQKERILLSLKKMGHVVGFLGDGVNDAPAMHAADTSISVEQAADVARAAADFVLLERHLDVIRRGIEEGRRTFANTMKYVLTTTSANLGNMASMAIASLFLPFLPLLAGQILLNNFLSDVPALGIASDAVDPELVDKPQRWSMRFIARFMVEFGALSSAFDALTFVTLLHVFHASPETFRTAWFVESLLTELVVALVVRTRRPFFRSRPGRVLLVTTLLFIPVALALPSVPATRVLGFVSLPGRVLASIVAITAAYVVAAEAMKRWFYRRQTR